MDTDLLVDRIGRVLFETNQATMKRLSLLNDERSWDDFNDYDKKTWIDWAQSIIEDFGLQVESRTVEGLSPTGFIDERRIVGAWKQW